MNVFANSRDIALIFLAIEGFFMALFPVALFGAMAYGVYRLNRWLRPAMQQAQVFMQQVNDKVKEFSYKIANPMVEVHSKTRMVTTIFNKLISGGNK